MDEIIGLFPTPFMRLPGVLPQPLVDGLLVHFSAQALQSNNASSQLSHTQVLRPSDSGLLVHAAGLITPELMAFGALLFGERMGWSIKEMWVNVLNTGGHQAMHNHANSFISGVVYFTPMHESARTDFSFKNDHAGVPPAPTTPRNESARCLNLVIWSCSPAIRCMRCPPMRATSHHHGAERHPHTTQRLTRSQPSLMILATDGTPALLNTKSM